MLTPPNVQRQIESAAKQRPTAPHLLILARPQAYRKAGRKNVRMP
jgi:hypothetical protein